jgi:hypothetical protein
MSYTVPVISQKTASMCWEACGHMMWDWYYRNNKTKLAQYTKKAGSYARMNKGLTENQMSPFYALLGLRVLKNPGGANVRHALKWTPVIVTSIDQQQGHAMVIAGFANGEYTVVNPCAVQTIDFSSNANTCTGGTKKMKQNDIDSKLGTRIWYW